MYVVFLKSEAYGEDTFECDSLAEVFATIKRLTKEAKESYKRDKIQREVGVRIGD